MHVNGLGGDGLDLGLGGEGMMVGLDLGIDVSGR